MVSCTCNMEILKITSKEREESGKRGSKVEMHRPFEIERGF